MLNKIMIIGNVGNVEQLQQLEGGTAAIKFSVATNKKWKDKNGEQREQTTWHNVGAYGKLAEIVSKYVSKGRQVYVEGEFSKRKYTDKSGQDRYWDEIIARELKLLGKREESPQPAPSSEGPAYTEDDIPF